MNTHTETANIHNATFLEQVASRLMELLRGDLSDTVVVFPNKRASLFFNVCLAKAGGNGPMWSPRYMTIDELFTSLTPFDVADPILAVCHLYRAYIEITGKDESLDKFYAWGETMIADFDDIDKNMVEARLLFDNIKDLDELTTLDYLTEEQRNAITRFFYEFKIDENDQTELKKEFYSLWKHMYAIYNEFKKNLMDNSLAYTGMLYRWAVEEMEKEGNLCLERLSATNYVFVGFNVLTKAEERLLKNIKQNKSTYFFWDYDEAYLPENILDPNLRNDTTQGNSVFEAGKFIYRNIKNFGNDLIMPKGESNLRRPKNISFISASTEDMQARYASQWVNKLYSDKMEGIKASAKGQQNLKEYIENIDFTRTAVVLCNESGLQSVMDAMPPTIGDTEFQLPVNITMGYPLNQTPVSSLIEALVNLQINGYAGNGAWKFKYVAALLNHPYMLMMSAENIHTVMERLKKYNIMYPNSEFLHKDNFLRTVFTPQADDVDNLLNYLIQLLRTIAITYNKTEAKHFSQYQLGVESIFNTHTILSRLLGLHATRLLPVQVGTMSRLLRQLLALTTIPFHGEPAEGVQVMGMLETRCLDFSDIIILSANENMLPKAKKRSSFIPYNLRQAFGMTTIDEEVSLYAYYFFRILQRANNITLLYNNSTESQSKGQMSRFLLQMLVDKDKIFAPGQKIGQYSLDTDIAVAYQQQMDIEKNKEVINVLRRKYDTRLQNGKKDVFFSPTAINTYLECRMKFYFRYVAGIKAEDEVTEDVDNAAFGTIFHKCMEEIYRPYIGRGSIQASVLNDIANDKIKITKCVDKAFREEFFKGMNVQYNGEQLLNREVICTYVENQLKHDMGLCPIRIIGVEKLCQTELDINVKGEEPIRINIGGIIDRFDEVTIDGLSYTRIVDYKTSSSLCQYKGLDSLFTAGKDENHAHHIRQAFYYADVVMSSEDSPSKLYPTLMYVKISKKCPPTLEFKPDNAKDAEKEKVEFSSIKDEYHYKLVSILEEIFNKEETFTQCTQRDACQYCDFKELCQ